MKAVIIILIFLKGVFFATWTSAQVYDLSLFDNTCRITECVETSEGIKPLGYSWKEHDTHDRFTLDFRKGTFIWKKEGKETYTEKITSYMIKFGNLSFTTKTLMGSLSFNGDRGCLGITYLYEGKWLRNIYYCRVRH